MKKRLASLIMTMAMAGSLVACGGGSKGNEAPTTAAAGGGGGETATAAEQGSDPLLSAIN